ncbi:MAG TPA: POTRA domain-containing protein [Candidatus Cybelea sp.]|nr:POTRA domain-containing protein [Candidatus Cybelea sp.]
MRRWNLCASTPTALLVSLCVLILVAEGSAGARPGPADVSIEGQRVTAIRITDEAGRLVSIPLPPLPLAVGKPFDFAVERDALRQLYRWGDYSDIRVTETPEAGGVRIDFVVRQNYYNSVVRIEGLKSPPTDSAALAAMRLSLGQPYRESSLLEGVRRLEDTLRADGLYLANIKWTLGPHSDTREMDVTVTVAPGPRARIGEITVEDHTPYTQHQLLRRAKIKPKQELTSARTSRSSQRLKDYLVSQGYLGATVVATPGPYDPQTNRVPLVFAVTTGPRVRVELTGAHLRKGQLRSLLPIYAEGGVDEDLLQEGRRNIRDYFQRQGYFDADVQYQTEDAAGNVRVIVYKVSRGDRFKLAGIGFTGNKYFSTSLLAGRLQLQPSAFASSGRFSQQLVRSDADSIRDLYVANGFLNAQVTPAVDDNYAGKKGHLFVTFHITEGAQTRVASLGIEGNRAISTDTLMAVIGSTKGQPYSTQDVASDRNNILALYYNEGFPKARFQEQVLPVAPAGGQNPAAKPAGDFVSLVYHIQEGPKIEVARVLLTGYQYTRPGIIRREVEIRPGGPLREGDVVETQRRLYNLGIFTRVQIAPQNPDGTDPLKTMVIDAEEGGRYTIGYGAGFEVQEIGASCGSTTVSENQVITTCNPNARKIAASPRGIFEISRANMFGRAQTLSFKVRASTLEYRAALTYTANNFLTNRTLSLQLTGYAEKSQDVATFTSTRYEGALQLVQKLSPWSSFLYRYFYRRVEASNLNQTINPAEIPLLSQPTLVSGVGITYARDRRDNPADAKQGTFNTADASVASTSLGSSASFFRGFFQNSSFTSFARVFVFARSVRFGIEEPLANTVEDNEVFNPAQCTTTETAPTEQIIPLPERFFAGGGTSLRGFALNEAGPRDACSGFPVGGLALLAFNQEIRFPMRLPWIGNRLGGTLFYDGGNVYTDVGHINFNWRSPSLTQLNYFSQTPGFGLRYPTPIGPVRVDFAYQLNPALYQYYNSSVQQFQNLRLPHFQFSFNIGPVF